MDYEIVQPPSLSFREMSKAELRNYFDWFMDAIPLRIDELEKAVKSTSSYEDWHAFNTPTSLNDLGQWLSEHVEMRSRTKEELEEIKSKLIFPMDIPKVELTNRTFSLAMDTGMYISQVFLHNHPSLRWTQVLRDKRLADYGQPVLTNFKPGPFNPVSMVITFAYGISRNKRDGKGLRELYDIWSNLVQTE